MTEQEWADLLQTYTTVMEVAEQSLAGFVDHLNSDCRWSSLDVLKSPNPVTCDRGTRGCALNHNDKRAIKFAILTIERIIELESGDEPMPELDPAKGSLHPRDGVPTDAWDRLAP